MDIQELMLTQNKLLWVKYKNSFLLIFFGKPINFFNLFNKKLVKEKIRTKIE
jgi:hypothetical protein